MKKGIVYFIMLSLLLCGCSKTEPLISPIHNKVETVTASDGIAFTVGFLEENFPDQEITITVSRDGQTLAADGSFDSCLSDYDYQNDFVEHWHQIVDERHSDGEDIYWFHWGLLRTTDKGKTYQLIPKHAYNESMPFAEQPTIESKGSITSEDLRPLPITGNVLFMSDRYVWSHNDADTLFQTDLVTGTAKEVGQYHQGNTLFQFTQTEKGTIWTSYSSGDLSSDEEITYLIAFDEQQATASTVKEWKNTSMFAKVVGYDNYLYTFRIVNNPLSEEMQYLIEKHDTETTAVEVLVESVFANGKGTTITSIDVDGNALYALVGTEQGTYQIVLYDLNGVEQKRYDMPEYTDEFLRIHSAPLDIEVFDGFVSIKSLQNYATVFQLHQDVAKRIYFTDNRYETIKNVAETPIPLPLIQDSAVESNYGVFFSMDKQLIVYDRTEKAFVSVSWDTGEKYPIAINNNGDVLFVEDVNKGSGWIKNYYVGNIGKFL